MIVDGHFDSHYHIVIFLLGQCLCVCVRAYNCACVDLAVVDGAVCDRHYEQYCDPGRVQEERPVGACMLALECVCAVAKAGGGIHASSEWMNAHVRQQKKGRKAEKEQDPWAHLCMYQASG